MPLPAKRIVVAGDAAIDWFMYPVAASDEGENWRLHSASHIAVIPGGVHLLGDFVRAALDAHDFPAEVVSPQIPGELCIVPPQQVIHSNAMLDMFTVGQDSRNEAYRVKESLGFAGPADGAPASPPLDPDPETADLILLDDAGNGFRDTQDAWPNALGSTRFPIVLHKMSRPLKPNPLWNRIRQAHGVNHIVVTNANDLRAISGVDISKSLSWERTAKDFVHHIQISARLSLFQPCSYFIVLFGTDGAIVYRGGDDPQATLVFDPETVEGGFAAGTAGTMYGLTSAFAATLAAGLARRGAAGLEDSVGDGLGRMRMLLKAGFGSSDGSVAYPIREVYSAKDVKGAFASVRIERSCDLQQADPDFWRILDHKTRYIRQLVAEELVLTGRSGGLAGVPLGKFGKLETIDRAEIESYNAIRELIVEFLENPDPKRPLAFAVFGPPGSGKSFGVKQVLKSIGHEGLQTLTFNISQFQNYEDLIAALHKVRDVALFGKVPFVFFDEFDSASEDGRLGWLKYFLAPMQDGEFKEGGDTHPVGNAIFVFAGGTRSSFQGFTPQRGALEREEFKAAKGPDFVSRLRGFINVMGPDRQGDDDDAFIIRRAKVIRSLLTLNPKTAHLFDSNGRLRIDGGVLRALLHVSEFKHGTRSIEAIFDMSRLAGKERFDLAALPKADQLNLHVDAREFLFLTRRERFCSMLADAGGLEEADEVTGDSSSRGPLIREKEHALVEAAARLIHQDFVRRSKLEGRQTETVIPFDELPPEKRESNRDAAADIPHKLRIIDHDLRKIPDGKEPRTPDITDEEVEILARQEHERWCREERLQGVVFSEKPITGKKTSQYLVPYADLPENIKQFNIQTVYRIPSILRDLGFEIYRMEEVGELDDPVLFDQLARALHSMYVEDRTREGQMADNNPSLVAFDDLPEDLKASNCDNAATVPRKLFRIGFGLRRVLTGEDPDRLELSESQIEALARMEHARWNWQRILQGWTYTSGEKDNDRKTTPYLVPWNQLEHEIQEYDRQTARLIPEMIQSARHEAYPLNSVG